MTMTTGRHAETSTLTLIDSDAAITGPEFVRTMTITVEAGSPVADIEISNNEGQPTYGTQRLVGGELDEYVARHLTEGWHLQF